MVLEREVMHEGEVADALAAFDPVWEMLTPKEQARLVALLVKRVEYDGSAGTVALVLHPNGLSGLADEVGAGAEEEEAGVEEVLV